MCISQFGCLFGCRTLQDCDQRCHDRDRDHGKQSGDADPFETRVTSRLYSIQSIDTFPAIGQPERIVEISKSVRSLMKNLRTKNVISGRTRSFRKEKRYNSLSVNTVENFTPAAWNR